MPLTKSIIEINHREHYNPLLHMLFLDHDIIFFF